MFGIGCRFSGWFDSLFDNVCFFFLHAVAPVALGNFFTRKTGAKGSFDDPQPTQVRVEFAGR